LYSTLKNNKEAGSSRAHSSDSVIWTISEFWTLTLLSGLDLGLVVALLYQGMGIQAIFQDLILLFSEVEVLIVVQGENKILFLRVI